MSIVTFDPARQTDSAYMAEAVKLYNQGLLEFSNKNDEKIFKGLLETSKDENQYTIQDDTEKNTSSKKSNAPSTGKKVNAAADLTAAAGTFIAGEIIKKTAVNKAMEKSADLCLKNTDAKKMLARDNSIGQTLECIMAFAVGTKYMASRPNKSEHHELNNLKEVMETGNLELVNGQEQLEESSTTVEDLQTEIEDIADNADKDVEELQKELEEKQARLEELEQKVQNGEKLTEAEKAEYDKLSGDDGEISQLQAQVNEIKAKEADEVDEKQEDVESEQETIDEVNDVFNSVSEVADYAETFDTATQTLSVVEALAQTANAVMGTKAGIELLQKHPMLALTTFGKACVAMAFSGAAMSTFGAVEQTKYSVDIGNEISVREDVQKSAAETAENIETESETIDTALETAETVVEGLDEDGEDKE